MALQGTLETFALPDVLRLLASTKKTGCYRLAGDRGSGALWLRDGQLVAGEFSGAPATVGATTVAFELLRFADGDFAFDDNEEPAEATDPIDVETALADAEAMLSEWAEIEAVVPSVEHRVALRAELPADEVTIRADRWIYVVAIAGGRSVRQLGSTLSLSDIDVCREVKALVELGVAEVTEPGSGGGALTDAPDAPDELEGSVVDFVPLGSEPDGGDGEAERFDPDELFIGRADDDPFGTGGTTDEASVDAPFEAVPFEPLEFGDADDTGGGADDLLGDDDFGRSGLATDDDGGGDSMDAAEIARQLASLSPKAAKAVAAAAKATTLEEREAALADVPEDETINRDLLLRFLGSVNS